ncbi:MAG TPA: DUF3857 domain-containing protein [Acidobacteriaceae bacterium]|jgi:hypothetical protein|nr:DUF3857 domain-containing protein [Acidobacteriaceae bacterium]
MTVDPAAPDAPAVYLLREEIVNEAVHYHRVYARIKILTEKGKEEYSDVEIPYEKGVDNVAAVEGRTIHADGTVVPFTGKPYQKELLKAGGVRIMAKVFSMPDVQVGSIVEYRYELQYGEYWYSPPRWLIQQPIYVHKAHYQFVPPAIELNELLDTDAFGVRKPVSRLLYLADLPQGTKMKEDLNGYELTVENIPPVPDEEYSPPMNSFSERVFFYYAPSMSGADYWNGMGKEWSKEVDRFAAPSDTIRQAVMQVTAPGDSDEVKLRKIYSAVMGLENTSFTREHSAAENRAEGLHVKTAGDIWAQKRGTDDEITWLFIAMARMAGMKADAMIVADRDENFLNTGYLNWDQLEAEIAIVTVGGKEKYFDPGERYCAFGQLHWRHAQVQGMRQTDKGPTLAVTPEGPYTENRVARLAELKMGADGALQGVIRIAMTGVEALRWRQRALVTDEATVKKEFEDEMQQRVPDGVVVKMNHFLNLTDPASQLMAVMDVSGSMGTATGKHVFVPGAFFEARVKPPFGEAKRQNPVDLHYPYVARDEVSLTLAAGLTMESLPTNAKVLLKNLALFQEVYGSKGSEYQQVRQMAMGTPLYKAEEYSQLRDFLQAASTQDQELLVLKRVPVAAATGAAGSGAQ